MKKILQLISCFILLTVQNSFSNDQKPSDSLLTLLNTTTQDTIRLRILDELSNAYGKETDFEKQHTYADQMRTVVEKAYPTAQGKELAYLKKMLGTSYINNARAYRWLGNYDKSLECGLEAKKIFEGIDSMALVANALHQIAMAHISKGNLAESIQEQSEAIRIYEKLKMQKESARLYVTLGTSYMKLGNYPEALKNELAALKILEAVKDSAWLSNCYNSIGTIYRLQKNYPEALKNQEAALKIAVAQNNKGNMATVTSSIGAAYSDMGKNDEALIRFKDALKLYGDMGNKAEVIRASLNIAAVYTRQKKHSEALKVLSEIIKQVEETHSKELISTTYYAIASNYSELKRYREAIDYFNKAIPIAKEMQSNTWLREFYLGISYAYAKNNDFKNAYQSHELYVDVNDSIYNETKSSQMAEMKTKYESEKKDDEIALLNKEHLIETLEIKKQKTLKYSFISVLATVSLLFVVVYRNHRTKELLKLQMLRNKIASELHDEVGSTLTSIALFSDVASEQSKEVIPMLKSIGENSRKMIESMADIVWTINPANDNFEKMILRMRSFAFEFLGAKNIDFDFKADEAVSQMKISMEARKNLYLIFKEAINNLVKYSEADRASFSITGNKNNLTMLIRDNGKGFDVNKETPGNGLVNMKKRALEIGAQFFIESESGTGTTIQLILKAA